ncbi:MAG TPA: ATP-dependent endonuclease [Clostridiales bacterium]|nr:MAG: ATP-dependent endonuclease [Clostridiales bacterium GWD2_32_19]HCC07654.1 ATP-dependent endonuclease [Clostridiales bacterium]
MRYIEKLKMINFKRFTNTEVKFKNDMNLIIGDNEAGKSSILEAIDFVLSGNKIKVENSGIEQLFNKKTVEDFMNGNRDYNNMPIMIIELYLNEQSDPRLNGENNIDGLAFDGLRMICEPNDELSQVITEILSEDDVVFPFEYYKISFFTFAGQGYTGYNRFMRKIFIDSTIMNTEYAAREYIKDVYSKNVTPEEDMKNKNEYRKSKSEFSNNVLNDLNEKIGKYSFGLKTDTKSNLYNDLSIYEDNIAIESMGKGRQCFIKMEVALNNDRQENDVDILLLEEPENHLSHVNVNKLIKEVLKSQTKQKFITTHSSMVSSRLDLRKAIMINSSNDVVMKLEDLSEDTAEFFIKAPNNNILEYVLSKKVILVEGDAEYILMEALFEKVTGEELSKSGIHIISVGGTSFKRYMDIGKLLNIKTAVIRDNDGDYQNNCIDNYTDYVIDHIKVFADQDNGKNTFEVCMYNINQDICEGLFLEGRKTLTVQEYMLKNKADAAFELLDKKSNDLVVPTYIKEAIEWIRE